MKAGLVLINNKVEKMKNSKIKTGLSLLKPAQFSGKTHLERCFVNVQF